MWVDKNKAKLDILKIIKKYKIKTIWNNIVYVNKLA